MHAVVACRIEQQQLHHMLSKPLSPLKSCLPAHEELHADDTKDEEDPCQQQHHVQKKRNGRNEGADQQPDARVGADGTQGP